MLEEIWERNTLPLPPANTDDHLFKWLRLVQDKQDIALVDFTPLPHEDLERLKHSLGIPPEELLLFYSYVTPWWNMANGFNIWKEHMEIAYNQFREAALRKREFEIEEIDQLIMNSPVIWPVSVSKEATIVVFEDALGRLAVIEGNIGSTLGRPLALGLRNYIIMTVVADIRWDERNYESYQKVLQDPIVSKAGKWPEKNPPSHFLIDAYEGNLWEP